MRYLIALGLCLIAGMAFAQSMGIGLGMHELRNSKAGPPAVPSVLLIDTGSKMLSNTGVAILIHN